MDSNVENHVRNFERIGHGSATLDRLRSTAIDRFATLGFPSTRLEDWKYTDVTPLAKTPFRLPSGANGSALTAEVSALTRTEGTRLVFVNGRFAPSLSAVGSLPSGVIVSDLASALASQPQRVEPYLARLAAYDDDSFVALNTAFIEHGAFVSVGRGVDARDTVQLLFVSGAAGEAWISHPRVLVVAEESSRVTVVETHLGARGTYCTNAVTEIAVGPNAAVTHCRVQEESAGAFHIGTVSARQSADSRFRSHSVSLGGRLSRCNVNAILDGPGAECSFDGLYLARDEQHVDFHTTIDHARPHGTSRELYKGVLGDRATAVFNGKVYVRPDAQKSDAGQVNRNLLLSDSATVNTKPQLEIFADDVKCSHGAAIGRLDPDHLFFLRSRGIGPDDARRLLIFGFANEVIERIDVEPVRERLERILWSRFHGEPRPGATP
jgi:Fe-S cluster assembly protein SufD